MSLKELTKQNHSNAERSWFAGRMFSGQITNQEYAIYLKQQYESYKALEDRFDSLDSSASIKFPDERIKRTNNIFKEQTKKIDIKYINLENVYKKKEDFTIKELETYINNNKDDLNEDVIDFSYLEITPKNLKTNEYKNISQLI